MFSSGKADHFIQEFHHHGFIHVKNVFSLDEVEEIKKELEHLYDKARHLKETTIINNTQYVIGNDAIQRVVWCAGERPGLLKYAHDPRITKIVSQILKSKIADQLICQAHYKMPQDEVAFDWHQDSQHRCFGTDLWKNTNHLGSYVQTLMAIDEMDIDNGPMQMVPLTGMMGNLHLEKLKDHQTSFEKLYDINKTLTVTMTPGSVLFFGPYSIHGSPPNNSDRPRRVFINGYAYPDCNERLYPGSGKGLRINL
jgi:ectoine hydroxylase-related dioxygenase (phytanoyl-CoA dioxygenase family)